MDNDQDSARQLNLFLALEDLAAEARPTLVAFSTGDDRDDIARYGLCLVLEAAELVNALPWKRWSRHPSDVEKAAEEFADLLCFIGSLVGLFGHLGVTPGELARAYISKTYENRERFAKHREEVDADAPTLKEPFFRVDP